MSKVNVVITTKTAKVSDKTLSRSHAVVVEGPTLPLGKGEGNFEFDILKVTRSKGGRAFDTVEVVVESRALGDKERARNPLKVDVGLELVFKGLLDEAKRLFLFQQVLKRGLVVLHDVLGRESSKGVFRVESGSHGRSFWFVWKTDIGFLEDEIDIMSRLGVEKKESGGELLFFRIGFLMSQDVIF